jgi:hypothetical protein
MSEVTELNIENFLEPENETDPGPPAKAPPVSAEDETVPIHFIQVFMVGLEEPVTEYGSIHYTRDGRLAIISIFGGTAYRFNNNHVLYSTVDAVTQEELDDLLAHEQDGSA